MKFTKHAIKRSNERCIPPIVQSWLDDYGRRKFDGRGGCIVYFDKSAIRKMQTELGRHFVEENKKYLRAYRVESSKEGNIITCGHRYKRISN